MISSVATLRFAHCGGAIGFARSERRQRDRKKFRHGTGLSNKYIVEELVIRR